MANIIVTADVCICNLEEVRSLFDLKGINYSMLFEDGSVGPFEPAKPAKAQAAPTPNAPRFDGSRLRWLLDNADEIIDIINRFRKLGA